MFAKDTPSNPFLKHPASFRSTACCSERRQPGLPANVTCLLRRFWYHRGSPLKTLFPARVTTLFAFTAGVCPPHEIGVFPCAAIVLHSDRSCANVVGTRRLFCRK